MSRLVTASLTIHSKNSNYIRFPYSLNITPIFSSATLKGIVQITNTSSQSQTYNANMRLNIGVTLTGQATLSPGESRAIPVSAELDASKVNSVVSGIIVSYYYVSGGSGASQIGRTLQMCIIYLSFTIPTAGDLITHSSLGQFVNFLTLYGTSHTTNDTILSASESSYPQGRDGGYSIVTGNNTTASYSGYGAGTVVSISYVDNPYNAYKDRGFRSS